MPPPVIVIVVKSQDTPEGKRVALAACAGPVNQQVRASAAAK
jgi:hypothetical protein